MLKTDYESAMAEIDQLMDIDPAPDTPLGRRLQELAAEVEAYETATIKAARDLAAERPPA